MEKSSFDKQKSAIWAKALTFLDKNKVRAQNERYYWDVTSSLREALDKKRSIERADHVLECMFRQRPIDYTVDRYEQHNFVWSVDCIKRLWRDVLWVNSCPANADKKSEIVSAFRRLKSAIADKDLTSAVAQINHIRTVFSPTPLFNETADHEEPAKLVE